MMTSYSVEEPLVLVVMGVCGSGKTSVAEALHEKLQWPLAEADDFHPEPNKDKMKSGIPLTDRDRYDWLLSLHSMMRKWQVDNQCGVVTCSALKRSYRNLLIQGTDSSQRNINITFVYLKGSPKVLSDRMTNRKGHFMPKSLLQSQLETLEEPEPDENHVTEDIEKSLQEIVKDIIHKLHVR